MTRPLASLPRDLTARQVAQALGMTEAAFRAERAAMERQRGFPRPDPTTGLTCPLALERWRQLRNPHLFPELTGQPAARHAATVDINARLAGRERWAG